MCRSYSVDLQYPVVCFALVVYMKDVRSYSPRHVAAKLEAIVPLHFVTGTSLHTGVTAVDALTLIGSSLDALRHVTLRPR